MERVESSQHSERELYALTTPNEEAEQASNESKQGGWITFPFITGTLFGLSLVAGGWASNLIVYLITEYNVKSITATKIFNVVQGSNCLFPVAGAIIADSFLGSFPVVAFFAFVSLLGTIMFTITATIQSLRPPGCAVGSHTCETPSNLQYGVLYMTLLLASLGLGGTRFTIATLGAGQFDKPNDQATFFNWYFFALYFANAISFSAVVYIQDNVSWGLGFGVCVIANAISLVLFVLGKRFYRQVKPNGSPFTSIARVMVAAIRKRKILKTVGRQDYYFGFTEASKSEDNLPTKSFRFLNLAALKTEGDRQLNGLYARSWKLCTVEEVEDLKTLIRIIPLWSTGIFLGISIGIFSSLVTLQALTMDRHLGPHFKIPAGTFLLFNILATIISILIIDRFLLPTWRNLARRTLTPLQRIGIGHIINIFGFVGAALIESKRLHVARTHHLMGQPSLVVSMSALWLVVPLGIVGLGEGFHFPGSVGLYYQEFPKSLKSTSTAMVSLLLAIGLYLSPAITTLVDRTTGWLPNNINDGRVDNVYWMLAVIGVVNFGYFLICAKMFKYQNVEDHNGPSGLAP
ncbi:protein NRT1/ PTR FAMILY 2.7 [Quercus suber]|uniref:protein NRT1/ PTR FAMILY 2.7 n=1 Tax=Quercus suber TaxID=58331 RepID=UPI000CE209F3|nr:protein NRT1/ PTR FAMILY 2.7-like [Quercus suber]POF19357.1 protein nrt1/ ptr family 2.7 [Quercus suber]